MSGTTQTERTIAYWGCITNSSIWVAAGHKWMGGAWLVFGLIIFGARQLAR